MSVLPNCFMNKAIKELNRIRLTNDLAVYKKNKSALKTAMNKKIKRSAGIVTLIKYMLFLLKRLLSHGNQMKLDLSKICYWI